MADEQTESDFYGVSTFAHLAQPQPAGILESVFKTHLLPVLTNIDTPQDLSAWQDLAGNLQRPIHVFSDYNHEYLFEIPPILRSRDQGLNEVKKLPSLTTIVSEANLKHGRLAAAGDGHIRRNITERLVDAGAHVEDIRQWNAILKRYGYEPRFVLDDNGQSASENSSGNDDDNSSIVIDGYDEL